MKSTITKLTDGFPRPKKGDIIPGMPEFNSENSTIKLEELDADRAAWLLQALIKLVELTASIKSQKSYSSTMNNEMFNYAMRGAIVGQAREICKIHGYTPGINLETLFSKEPEIKI